MTHIATRGVGDTPATSVTLDGKDLFGTAPDVNALRLLRDAGCPACASTVENERAYWFWFTNESHANPDVLSQLAGSLGWCPAHTRAFLAVAVVHTANSVFGAIVPAVHRRLLSTSIEIGRCPACLQVEQAGRAAVTTVLGALNDRKVRSRYSAHGGLCLPHVRHALDEVHEPDVGIFLLDALDALLGSSSIPVSTLTMPDGDAVRRSTLRAQLLARISAEPTFESARDVTIALRALLAVDCCTACAAAARAETRLLNWLPKAWRTERTTIEREYAETCSAHLLDLAALDPHVASAVLRAGRSRRRHEIDTCREELAPLLRRRHRHRHRRAPQTACAILLRTPPACPVCKVSDGAEASHLQLLDAALRDQATRDAYEASLGVCTRHFRTIAADAPAPVRSVIDARLAVVSWELGEASRKSAWAHRFEPHSAEQHSWRRAPALLDGRTYLGNPPPEA